MNFLLLVYLLLIASCTANGECTVSNCTLPHCSCFGSRIPGNLAPADVPQMVMITFDDAVTKLNFEYFTENLSNRRNPNGCNVSATFFISHNYNDYSLTHRLFLDGHEIALHSISHNLPIKASVRQLRNEYIGMKEILHKFGKIPLRAMKGVRAPNLQMSGDNTFRMMQENGIEWDSSWSTVRYSNPPIWPYTLDFPSKQDCPIPPCPTKSFPGLWEVPLVAWFNEDGVPCAMVDTCPYLQEEDRLFNLMKMNFNRHYHGNRAPFPFFIHAAWFDNLPTSYGAYVRFLDYLKKLPDVYIMSISQVIEWIKNPSPLSKLRRFQRCQRVPRNDCSKPRNCKLSKEGNKDMHLMESCIKCPDVFPWVGNPSGSKSTKV